MKKKKFYSRLNYPTGSNFGPTNFYPNLSSMQYYILQLLAPLISTPVGKKWGRFFGDMGPLLKKKLFSTHAIEID